jgi:hypothetical protein
VISEQPNYKTIYSEVLMINKIIRPRNIVLLVLLLAVAALSYGFAAQLTLSSSETIVGSGSTTLTAYNNVVLTWTLGATPNVDPTAHLDFATPGYDATEVFLGYSSDNSTWTWITCQDLDTNDVWDCIFSGSVAVSGISYVQVVARGAN